MDIQRPGERRMPSARHRQSGPAARLKGKGGGGAGPPPAPPRSFSSLTCRPCSPLAIRLVSTPLVIRQASPACANSASAPASSASLRLRRPTFRKHHTGRQAVTLGEGDFTTLQAGENTIGLLPAPPIPPFPLPYCMSAPPFHPPGAAPLPPLLSLPLPSSSLFLPITLLAHPCPLLLPPLCPPPPFRPPGAAPPSGAPPGC